MPFFVVSTIKLTDKNISAAVAATQHSEVAAGGIVNVSLFQHA